MAIATSTAIAIGGLAVSATSAGMSFAQASKQRKAQKRAERDAEKAMAEARGKLDVNFAEQMSIKKEAYDLEREALNVQGAQATEAGRESERGAAATAGRVYAAQQAGQGQVRSAMADEMTNIEQAIVDEDSREWVYLSLPKIKDINKVIIGHKKIQEDLIQHFDDEYNKDLNPTENSDWRQHQIKEQKSSN